MIGSLVLFVLCIIIYITISDIITIFFRLTGMTEERARFQVVSLLTNSGFTTQESEAVVASKRRRMIARATMLFGYAFTVTIVSTMVNFFTSLDSSELSGLLVYVPVLSIVLLGYYFIRKSSFFKTRFDSLIENIGGRIMFGKNANKMILMEDYGDMVVAHIYLHTVPELLRDVPLSATEIMSRHQIMVMMVKSLNQAARQANADTVLRPHDIIIVLGRQSMIRDIFERSVAPANEDEAKEE